ncbi:uncharacterized protein LOC125959161 [Anopheles darlingi]|uniref:uncharacterized protein LOC125959161 n=1 Tax=Anopheles darlingi TaxID=43151 RepID=UPI0021000906|nr:uncharacterized protein LOC125959161 [Anopheles darlingi]
MEKKFVSAFKINGVPILPPLINDEVRAMINDSRQKAIEIERRIFEETITNKADDDDDDDPLKKHENEQLPTEMVDHRNGHDDHDQSEQTPVEGSSLGDDEAPTVICEPDPEVIAEEAHKVDHVEPEIDQLDSCETIMEENNDPCDPKQVALSLTRTVTPTGLAEQLPWVPLVRCNTFDLQKPSIDLKMLQSVQHSTPVDRSKSVRPLDPAKTPQEDQNEKTTQIERLSIDLVEGKSIAKSCESAPTLCSKQMDPSLPRIVATLGEPICNLKSIAIESVPLKKVSKGKSKSRSRRSSNCSGSSTSTVNLSVESISNALSEHEKRMKELLKRQEEERMLLERKFREQTEELVALCAKATINGNPPVSLESNGAAVLKTSSTVSMLSLCDISYDSAPDTDTDAAYVTCNNNGTSDELLSGIEEPAANTIDTNGNGGSHSIPLEDSLQRVQRAAIIINAYARGYLTRRLFQTSEVQSIKQTIVDILTFIVNSRNGQGDDLDASLRRNAFKHIAFCLDRLHDVFVNYTPQQRMQMIRRDRYLKRKEAALPRTN